MPESTLPNPETLGPSPDNRTKLQTLLRALRADRSEFLRMIQIAMTSLKFRFLIRTIAAGTIVEPGTRMIHPANIHIGANCLIKEQVYLRAGMEGSIQIGDRAALNSFCRIFGHGGVSIGPDTQVGPGCLITTTGHDYHGGLETTYQPVVIGAGVWMGANVTILPGVTIGDRAVIGAGAVVNRDVGADTLAVGVPASAVKRIHRGVSPDFSTKEDR